MVVGDKRWDKVPGGNWQQSPQTPIHQPTPFWSSWIDARVLSHTKDKWRVSFYAPTTPGWFELLIQKRTMRPLDMQMAATAHFMHQAFSSFNEPLRITPPSVDVKKAEAAVVVATSRIRFPLEMSRARASWLVLLAVASAVALSFAAGSSGAPGDVGWRGWGNTPDNMRLSPLTQITKGNIDQVGRVFTFNFRSVDPNARLGNQSYPVVLGNRMYVTTGESQTWALDATTGKVIWRWTPNNVAVFNKAGIVANRGVAVCDGKVFVLTIDMTIAMLNQNTGELIKRVPISSAVPGAATRYGYSETSAPICARHRVITGAAGSEYGVRGFVMAFKSSDLSPAWANPVWSIPPSGTSWRQRQPHRRRRRRRGRR